MEWFPAYPKDVHYPQDLMWIVVSNTNKSKLHGFLSAPQHTYAYPLCQFTIKGACFEINLETTCETTYINKKVR